MHRGGFHRGRDSCCGGAAGGGQQADAQRRYHRPYRLIASSVHGSSTASGARYCKTGSHRFRRCDAKAKLGSQRRKGRARGATVVRMGWWAVPRMARLGLNSHAVARNNQLLSVSPLHLAITNYSSSKSSACPAQLVRAPHALAGAASRARHGEPFTP